MVFAEQSADLVSSLSCSIQHAAIVSVGSEHHARNKLLQVLFLTVVQVSV